MTETQQTMNDSTEIDQLNQRIEDLESDVDGLKSDIEENETQIHDLKSSVKEKNTQINVLESNIEKKDTRIDDLKNELQEYRGENEKDKADVKKRVTSVENAVEEQEFQEKTPDQTDNPETPRAKTPLDYVLQLPEHIAKRELTANQERARFVAKNILDYAKKTPAGAVVSSADIRKILTAKEGRPPHSETISRVIKFLERFGKNCVEVVKRRGMLRVAFNEEAANRYHHTDTHDQESVTGVVTRVALG